MKKTSKKAVKKKVVKKDLNAARAEYTKKKSVLDQNYKKFLQTVFDAESKKLFKEFPDVESFGWNQYTPSWNDGDTCYFGVDNYGESLYINGKEWDDDEDEAFAVARNKISLALQQFRDEEMELLYGEATITMSRGTGIAIGDCTVDDN